jgi:hypothetical protein
MFASAENSLPIIRIKGVEPIKTTIQAMRFESTGLIQFNLVLL